LGNVAHNQKYFLPFRISYRELKSALECILSTIWQNVLGNAGSVTHTNVSVTPNDGTVTHTNTAVTPNQLSVTPNGVSVTHTNDAVTLHQVSVTHTNASVTPNVTSVTYSNGMGTDNDVCVTYANGNIMELYILLITFKQDGYRNIIVLFKSILSNTMYTVHSNFNSLFEIVHFVF